MESPSSLIPIPPRLPRTACAMGPPLLLLLSGFFWPQILVPAVHVVCLPVEPWTVQPDPPLPSRIPLTDTDISRRVLERDVPSKGTQQPASAATAPMDITSSVLQTDATAPAAEYGPHAPCHRVTVSVRPSCLPCPTASLTPSCFLLRDAACLRLRDATARRRG